MLFLLRGSPILIIAGTAQPHDLHCIPRGPPGSLLGVRATFPLTPSNGPASSKWLLGSLPGVLGVALGRAAGRGNGLGYGRPGLACPCTVSCSNLSSRLQRAFLSLLPPPGYAIWPSLLYWPRAGNGTQSRHGLQEKTTRYKQFCKAWSSPCGQDSGPPLRSPPSLHPTPVPPGPSFSLFWAPQLENHSGNGMAEEAAPPPGTDVGSSHPGVACNRPLSPEFRQLHLLLPSLPTSLLFAELQSFSRMRRRKGFPADSN